MDTVAWSLVGLVAALVVVHRGTVRALWLRHEDPRTVATFRIITGALLLAWLVDLAPIYDYLFSDVGLLTGSEAQRRFGRGERWSLLYHYGEPGFVRAYAITLGIACFAFTVGLATRVTKWLTLALLHGLITRNGVYLGGEQLFASFVFYLCLSRCGEAYGVDAWLRRRRGQGMRPIPGWPRLLMLLQLVPVLCVNGLAKFGSMWRKGDTFYYLANHPHFRPGEMWGLSATFGTNLFRWMTWVVHAFEVFFPIALVGVVLRMLADVEAPPRSARARLASRVLLVALGIDVAALAGLRWPVGARDHLPYTASIIAAIALIIAGAVPTLLRRFPSRGWHLVTHRAVWATLLALFGAQLFVVLKIGWFTGLTMSTAILFVDGEEIGRWVAKLRRRAALPCGPCDVAASPARRWGIGVLSAVHVVAVTVVVLPADKPVHAWRAKVEWPLRRWVDWTTSFQVWRMFAPNGARVVYDLHSVVVDDEGRERQVGAGIVDRERASSAWSRDKREKVRRRIGHRGRAYRAGHAAWVCRRFAEPSHGDVAVRLYGTRMTIPSPEELAASVPEALQQQDATLERALLHESACSSQ